MSETCSLTSKDSDSFVPETEEPSLSKVSHVPSGTEEPTPLDPEDPGVKGRTLFLPASIS